MLGNHPNYDEYAHKLSPGWLFGRQVVSEPTNHSVTSVKEQKAEISHRMIAILNITLSAPTYQRYSSLDRAT